MPFYDFKCLNKKCGHVYEDLCDYDETDKYPTVRCPKCKSKRKQRTFTGKCNIIFKGTSNTSHEVAFGHKYEQAQEERRRAEAASHMGGGGYNEIDDLNSGDYFGEVK
jgi:putative FmdB family regulatory protein